MRFTDNYNLNLPDLADQYNLEHWNENTSKIDEQLKFCENNIENLQQEHQDDATAMNTAILENKNNIETETSERKTADENLQKQIDTINNEWMGELLYSISDTTKLQKTETYTTTEKSMVVCYISGGSVDQGEYFSRVVANGVSICSVWMEDGEVGVGNSIIVPKGVTLSLDVKGSTQRKASVNIYKTS